MKFSDDTLSILKNFSTINRSIMFRPGNMIRTISPQKEVIASAMVDEEFETSAGVYDLSRFLSTVTLFKEPEIEFGKDRFIISSGKSRVKYTYTSENMILTPPDKDLQFGNVDWKGDVSWEDLQNTIKAAGVLGVNVISFEGGEDGVVMSALDKNNPTSDNYSVDISGQPCDNFKLYAKLELLKLIPADYNVTLSSDGIAHFKSDKVQYWIGLIAE